MAAEDGKGSVRVARRSANRTGSGTTYARWAGLCGIIGPFIALGFIFGAVACSPWWSLTDNSISRLAGGEGDRPYWSATGPPAILLNTGLLVSGAFMVVFAYGLVQSRFFEWGPGRVGKYTLMVAGIFMMLIGVFPLTFGLVHDAVSYSFFILNAIALWEMGLPSATGMEGSRNTGRLMIVLGMFCLVPFLLPLGLKGLAIPEFMALVPLVIFSVMIGWKLFTSKIDKVQDRKTLKKNKTG